MARERGRTEEDDDSGRPRKTEEARRPLPLEPGAKWAIRKNGRGYTPTAGPESIGYVLHGVAVTKQEL